MNSSKKSWLVATIVLSIIGSNIFYLFKIREQIVNEKKQSIVSVLNTAQKTASIYVKQHIDGLLTKRQAETALIEALTTNNKDFDYIWINDNDGIARAHIRPEIIGQFQSSYINHIAALKHKDIIFETKTNLKPKLEKIILKINGIAKIPDWDWVFGYGVYEDDIEDEFLEKSLKTIPYNIISTFALIFVAVYKTKKQHGKVTK